MLVFYIAISIILSILNLSFLISVSKLELNIENLDMSNINKKQNNQRLSVKISLKIGKFHWLHFKLNKHKLATIYAKIKKDQYKKNITNEDLTRKAIKDFKLMIKNKEIKKELKETKINIEKINIDILIGTKDYIMTSYLVTFISIIISNILPHILDKNVKIEEDIFYKINPIYHPINMYNLKLSTIINIKVSDVAKNALEIRKQKKEEKQIKKLKMSVQPV